MVVSYCEETNVWQRVILAISPYCHSIMNFNIACDPCDGMTSLSEYKGYGLCLCVFLCFNVHVHLQPHAAGNLRKHLTQKTVLGMWVITLSNSPPHNSFPSRPVIMLVPTEIAFCLSGQYNWAAGCEKLFFMCKCFLLLVTRGLWSATMVILV